LERETRHVIDEADIREVKGYGIENGIETEGRIEKNISPPF